MLALTVAALGLIACPSFAAAADTTINFDNLAAGTAVTSQYAPDGVTFNPVTLIPPVIREDLGGAHSPPNVLNITVAGCGGENGHADLRGVFAAPRSHVSLFVGDVTTGLPELVTLTGFDAGGNPIGAATQTVMLSGGIGLHTAMSIADPDGRISSFEVLGDPAGVGCVAIDDLAFDPPPSTIAPDFSLVGPDAAFQPIDVSIGGSRAVSLGLRRSSTSTGAISFDVSGLPQGVTASLSPNPTTGGDGSVVTLTLTAAAGAQPATGVPVTVTGIPSPSAGSGSRSVTIRISVAANAQGLSGFDLRAQGIDVTQGIVNTGVLVPSGGASGGAYRGISPSPAPDSAVTAGGSEASLVAHNKTVVRVYADARGAPAPGVPGVQAQLHGYRNGVELPGSPLLPDYGPANLPDTGETDPAPVVEPERSSDANAFTFTLPDVWTQGTITMVSDILPPFPTFTGPQYVECPGPACQANNSFTLKNISFITLPYVVIAPLAVGAPGDPPLPASPVPVYKRALLTEPGANQYAVLPYVGTVDPTPEINADNAANPTPGIPPPPLPSCVMGFICNRSANTDYYTAVKDWGTKNLGAEGMLSQPALPADMLVGIQGTQPGLSGFSVYNEPLDNPSPGGGAGQVVSSVNFRRPFTSVAHELGHALGRNHADNPVPIGCTGNGGPWPPDGKGYIQGIGLDMSSSPYKSLAPGLPGEPAQWFDKMSYCANAGAEFNGNVKGLDTWTSPFGWLHSIDALTGFGQRTGRASNLPFPNSGFQGIESRLRATAAQRAVPARPATPRLVVTGTIFPGAGGAQINVVTPTTQPSPKAPPAAGGGVQLVARDAAGRALATVAMATASVHGDPGPAFLAVEGTVPAPGVDSVEVVQNGTVVATRIRSRVLPRVRIETPRAGPGSRVVVVRSQASGAPGHALAVAIDYSTDNGNRWRGIYAGPNRGSVSLPRAYFSSSRNARVRIRVDDGFNQTQAVSRPFKAAGAPPSVTISDPLPGQSFRSDAAVSLHGQAFDDALRPLLGRSLRWLAPSGALIGRGATILARGLPPGADGITLQARDATGRTTTASVVVHITAVALPFLRLQIPGRVSRRARQLALRVSSALPATLTVTSRRYPLSLAPRTVILKITPGRAALLLKLSVTARGLTEPITAVVSRK